MNTEHTNQSRQAANAAFEQWWQRHGLEDPMDDGDRYYITASSWARRGYLAAMGLATIKDSLTVAQQAALIENLKVLAKSFGHKVGCAKNAFGEQCTCGVDEAITAAEQVTLCASCARANVDCPIYPQQTASCVEYRPAAQQQAEPVEVHGLGTPNVDVSVHDGKVVHYDNGPNLAEALARLASRVAKVRNLPAPTITAQPAAVAVTVPQGWASVPQRVQDDITGLLEDTAHAAQYSDQAAGVKADYELAEACKLLVAMLAAAPQATAEDSSVVGDAVAVPTIKLGLYGRAFDTPQTRRAYTYQHQPDNLDAYSLGRAAASTSPGGDNIDRGLSLLKELQAHGFGVFELGDQQEGGA